MRIVGAGGDLRVGYQHAGVIAMWAVTTTPRADGEVDVDLEVTPAALDPYWSAQRPLTVQLSWFGSRRRWRNVVPAETGSTWRFQAIGTPEVL